MFTYKHTDLLESHSEAIVNTVNTVGIMGKGIALQFKEHFPLNFKLYRKACKEGIVHTGKMFVTETGQFSGPKYIINFPTKTHWRANTKLEYVSDGLDDLVRIIRELKISSIAVPPLGCGNGGLDWNDVRPLIESKLSAIADNTAVDIYEPGHHSYTRTTIAASVPKLTKGRALILALAKEYSILGFDISHLEIQKLAYFLQELGQKDMNLRFEKGHYGPYASNLKHLLAHLEGYYFKGQIRFQDMRPTDSLTLVEEQLPVVKKLLSQELQEDEKQRFENVSKLIEGFESPFGLELLATVHWAAKEQGFDSSLETVKSFIDNWSKRKSELMTVDQVGIALSRINTYFA